VKQVFLVDVTNTLNLASILLKTSEWCELLGLGHGAIAIIKATKPPVVREIPNKISKYLFDVSKLMRW